MTFLDFRNLIRAKKLVIRHKCMLPSFTLGPASYFTDILLFKHSCDQASLWGKKRHCLLNWAQKVMVEVLIFARFFIVSWMIILQHFGLLRLNMYQVILAIFNIAKKNIKTSITFRDDPASSPSLYSGKESFQNTTSPGAQYVKRFLVL